MRAELARRGLTLETWAAQIRAKAQAAVDRNRRARRMRVLKIAAAAAAGLAALAGLALALRWSMQAPMSDTGASMSRSLQPLPPLIAPDAGADASRRR
jgi:hypothetical protein